MDEVTQAATIDPETEFKSNEQVELKKRIWYETGGRGRYWHENNAGVWVSKSETQLRRWLKGQGVDPVCGKHDVQSDLDDLIKDIETDNLLTWCGALAGYKVGFYWMAGQSILVTHEARLIVPEAPGDDALSVDFSKLGESRPWDDLCLNCVGWPTLGILVRNLLSANRDASPDQNDLDEDDENFCVTDDDCDQRVYYFGWIERMLRALYAGKPKRGHAILLAGEPGCGKSLLIDILVALTGGRKARPLAFITGQTNFNSDLFPSVMQIIDDEGSKTHIQDRKHLSARVKQMVAVKGSRMEAKNKDPLEIEPLWRLVFATNLEEQNLLVFPPIDNDIRGKVLLFKAFAAKFPWPKFQDEEDTWATLEAEFPYFLHWLFNRFVLPNGYKEQRMGVVEWLHPEIRAKIEFLSPEVKLMGLLERSVLANAQAWKGSANELVIALKKSDSGLTRKEIDWVPAANPTVGKYLKDLSDMPRFKGRIKRGKDHQGRYWVIAEKGVLATIESHRRDFQEELPLEGFVPSKEEGEEYGH